MTAISEPSRVAAMLCTRSPPSTPPRTGRSPVTRPDLVTWNWKILDSRTLAYDCGPVAFWHTRKKFWLSAAATGQVMTYGADIGQRRRASTAPVAVALTFVTSRFAVLPPFGITVRTT